MNNDLIDILHEGHHSLVVANGDIAVFDGRGVSDLYSLLNDDPGFLDGADIADKVVGKGAAALMILGKAASVYADVISSPALQLLRTASIRVTFSTEVSNIVNRKGDGICPVESLCCDCATAEECLPLLAGFINSNKNV